MRKNIGVCMSGYDLNNEVKIIKGMRSRCNELGFNMLVFTTSIKKPEMETCNKLHEDTLLGEIQIFRIINYDMLDGMVIFGGTMIEENTYKDIVGSCKKHEIPLINVDDLDHENCRRVLLTDRNGMEQVVDHVIEEHGARDICFINGFKNNPQSDSRLAAYRTSLEKHGIEYDESKVYYGKFWKYAYDCTEEILQRGKLPDAVVCANDTMAIYCMDCFKDHKVRVPKDVIVTGFDALPDGEEYTPSPTTVRRSLFEAGIKSVDALAGMMNDSGETEDIYVDASIVKSQSCGCVPLEMMDENFAFNNMNMKLNRSGYFNQYILCMHNSFAGLHDTDELLKPLYRGAELMGIKKMYVCLSAEIVNRSSGYNADEEPKGLTYIPPRMISMFMFGHYVPNGTEFATSEIFPEEIGIDEPEAYYILPLYFKKTFLGYTAIGLDSAIFDGNLFSVWLITIANNIGSFYMQNQLQEALAELQNLYLHDPLTGIYNRRGMNKFESGFIKKAHESGKQVSVICADVDGLKSINDNYGHEEGDNAIVQSTHAIKASFPEDSLCVRTGGDEFTIIAAFNSESEVHRAIDSVAERIAEYNETSGKPYKVGCSCGFCMADTDIEPDIGLDVIKKKADMAMYSEKLRRKSVRTD